MKANGGKGDIAPLILSLGTILEWSASRLVRFTPLQEGFRYPLNRRLPATHTRDARFVKGKNILPLSVIELRFIGSLVRSLDTTSTSLLWLSESQTILLKTIFPINERNCPF